MAIVKSLAASSVRPWLRFSKNNQTVTGIEVCLRRAIPAFCATCRGTSVVPRVLVLTHRHLHKSPCDRRPFAEISGSISFSPLWFLSRKLCPIFVCQFKGSLEKLGPTWVQNNGPIGPISTLSSAKATESTRFMERAMGIEIIATWFFKDLRSRARTDLEGLGSLRNPYCRLDAALLP